MSQFDNFAARKILLDRLDKLSLQDLDVATVKDSHWLNDQAVNGFLFARLLQSRLDLSEIVCFPTYLFNQIQREGHSAVESWTRNTPDPSLWNVFQSRLVIFPINTGNNHWIVGIVDVTKQSGVLYDSLGSSKKTLNPILSIMEEFLKREHLSKQARPLPKEWKFYAADTNEKQRDGCSCGVFVCRYVEMYIEAIEKCKSLPPSVSSCFVSESIPMMRLRISGMLTKEVINYRRSNILRVDQGRRTVYVLSSVYSIPRLGAKALITRLPLDIVRKLAMFLCPGVPLEREDGSDVE